MRKRVVVSGRVQGVFFRDSSRQQAARLGVAGRARNLPDGRVEVVLEGPADDVAAVLDALDGPRAPGSVSRVDVSDQAARGSTGFTTA
jgi:acylphosphatase